VTGLPIVFGPVHIAFLEMVIDPVCSLVLEAEREEEDVMRRPPRPPKEPLLTRRLAGWSLFEGMLAFSIIAGIYMTAIASGFDDATVRTMTFVSVVSVVFSLIVVNRTYSASILRAILAPNIALAAVTAFVAIVLTLTLSFEPVRELFRFGGLTVREITIAGSAGLASLLLLEGAKHLLGRRRRV
jgi:Ca2+-transporting ATPase